MSNFDQTGASAVATGIVFTLEVLGTIAAVIFCYRIYGSVKKRPWYVTACVYFFWPLCFFVPLLIPNDVVSSEYRIHCLLNSTQTDNSTLINQTLPIDAQALPPALDLFEEKQSRRRSESSEQPPPLHLPNDAEQFGFNVQKAAADNFNDAPIKRTDQNDLDRETVGTSRAYDCSKAPAVSISHEAMVILWNFVYWPGFFGTWVILPFLMDFSMSGEFTIWARSRYSIKFNLLLYVTLGFIFGIGLLVLTIVKGPDQIIGFCIAMGNAYGLVCTLILLSFGLVQVPRKIWRKGSSDVSLQWFAYRAQKARRDLSTYRFKLRKAIDCLQRTAQNNNVTSQSPEAEIQSCATCRGRWYTTPDDRTCVASIIKKAHPYFEEYTARTSTSNIGDNHAVSTPEELVKLHEQIMSRVHAFEVERINYDRTLQKSFKLMDVTESLERQECREGKYIEWTCREKQPPTFWTRARSRWEYYWFGYCASIFWRIVGVLFAILSLIIVWCETTVFATNPNLSVLWYFINAIPTKMGQEVVIFLLLFYLASCVFYGLFRIRIFNYYRMHKCQMTDSRGLLFCTAWLCRLLAPIAYNFLLMTHLKDGTAFAEVMHSMDVVPFIGDAFNIYLPCALAPLCLLTMFNAFGRLAHLCGIKVYRFEDTSDHSEEIHTGMILIREERQRRKQDGNAASRTVYRGMFSAHLSSSNLSQSLSSSQGLSSPTRLEDEGESGLDDVEDLENRPSWFADAGSKFATWWRTGPSTDAEQSSLLGSSTTQNARANLAQRWQTSTSYDPFEEQGI